MKLSFTLILFLSLSGITYAQNQNLFEDYSNRPPAIITADCDQPPSDATVLFNGDLDKWQHKDGSTVNWNADISGFTVQKEEGDIYTKKSFGDCQLHVEWKVPANEKHNNLNWGNSGIYLMGLYEVQIYDSYNYQHDIYFNGQAGSIYKQYSPLVNASRPAGEWQSFDILFTAPIFNTSGELDSPARLTVFHNGVIIQNHVELIGPTTHEKYTEYKPHPDKLPLMIQSHGSAVSFRNIWIREL